MAGDEPDKLRPNIRVQILNNLAERMDVDEEDENEEGEISDNDNDEGQTAQPPTSAANENSEVTTQHTYNISVLTKVHF